MLNNNSNINSINDWTDFWYYEIGVNVIPADTKNKQTFENWSHWQDKPISDELHEQRKRNGDYKKGIAIVTGQIWRGRLEGKYLVAIDLDNKKAIEEFCGVGLEELKQKTLVEQTSNPEKIHIYFIVERKIPNKASDKCDTEILKKINANDVPALEVKSNGKGIMFCSNSPHKNGSNYKIIGTLKPQVFNAHDIEDRIGGICLKYGMPYGFNNSSNNNNSSYQTSIEDLWKPETKILQGHNRHKELLRVIDSLLARNRGILSLDKIKELAYQWNQEHCIPPLDDKEFEKEWKQSSIFVAKSINSNIDNNTTYYNGNGNGHSSNNKYYNYKSNIQPQTAEIILELEKRRINSFEFVVNSIKKTVKCEDTLIRQILYTGLSAYVEDEPINLGVLAPTSEGKTYAITETFQYFPNEDIMYIGKMSTMVLVRQKGIPIDKKTGEQIGNKIQELRTKIRDLVKKRGKFNSKDKDEKENLNDEIDKIDEDIRKIIENSKTLIDLRGKILVFLEPPQHELWELLKPILSHDKKEIEFPFVDKTKNSNAETKEVVVRGWPACIFCLAKDESKWEIWDEIKSRILTTSPNMVPQKYEESKKLISQSKGLPNLIQQQIIISDKEREISENCILLIKQKIQELKKSSNNKNHQISTWIPYYELLDKELPANKGTDVRFSKKVFSLLNIISIVNSDIRMVLRMEGENSIIANLEDLKEVLSITQNYDGLPRFKAEFFNDVFCPLFKSKTEPDSNRDGTKKEDVIAVTTKQLCDYYKEKKGKSISTDSLKQTYLNQLINEGIIDYTQSKINGRENIYYPIVTNLLSLLSNINSIDNASQQATSIFEKITKNITEGWIFHEIIGLICCRFGYRKKETIDIINESDKLQIIGYLNNLEKFQILDNNNCIIEEESRRALSISEFIQKYSHIINTSIDNKPSNILTDFAKRSHFLSSLYKIDDKDNKEESREEKWKREQKEMDNWNNGLVC
jgi:hypothetical protein